MAEDKLNDIFERAVSKSQNKYDLLGLKIDNTKKLKGNYNLEMVIKSTRRNTFKYDLHNVFTFFKPH